MPPDTTVNPIEGTGEDIVEGIAGLLEREDASTDTDETKQQAANPEDEEPKAETKTDEESKERSDDEVEVEAEDAEDEPAKAEEPETYEVEVQTDHGAVKERVTLDGLKSGYMRDADYRQKTAGLADDKRQFEATRGQAAQALQARLDEVDQLVDSLSTEINGEEVDDTLVETDPEAYLRAKARQDKREKSLKDAETKRNELRRQEERDQMQQLGDYIKFQQDQLARVLPQYSDPAKGEANRGQLKTYLVEKGFSETEIKRMLDHRTVVVAHEAMLYGRAKKRALETRKQFKKAPTMKRPGTTDDISARGSEATRRSASRLQRTGRVEDAAKLIETLI